MGNPRTALLKLLHPGEELLWYGQPAPTRAQRSLRPVQLLLTTVAVVLLFFAAWTLFAEAVRQGVSPANLGQLLKVSPGLAGKVLMWLGAAVFFGIFRLMLPQVITTENSICYGITSQRLLIAETGRNIVLRQAFGPGDVVDATLVRHGDSSGDVLFAEETVVVGNQQSGAPFRRLSYVGFRNLPDYRRAFEVLQEWRRQHSRGHELANETLGFSLTIPGDWTTHRLLLRAGQFDHLLTAVLAADLRGEPRLFAAPQVAPRWNTLLLTRKSPTPAGTPPEKLGYLKIIVEALVSPLQPRLRNPLSAGPPQAISLNDLIEADAAIDTLIRETLLVCPLSALVPVKHPEGSPEINFRAREMQWDGPRAYSLSGSFSLLAGGYSLRQIYLNVPAEAEGQFLHLRFSFISDEKAFKKNQSILEKIARSLRLPGETPAADSGTGQAAASDIATAEKQKPEEDDDQETEIIRY